MTCASPSFHLSGKCPHATHSLLPSADVQIPFMYCLGTLVLDRLASYPTHGIPLITRIHGVRCGDERRGRRCRNEAGSHVKVKRAGHRAPELRSHFISDAGCYTSKLRTRSGNTPLQPRSRTNCIRAIIISGCRSLYFSCACICVANSYQRKYACVLRNRTTVRNAKEPRPLAFPELCSTR